MAKKTDNSHSQGAPLGAIFVTLVMIVVIIIISVILALIISGELGITQWNQMQMATIMKLTYFYLVLV